MRSIALPAEPLLDGSTALRPWRESDLPALVAACQDPSIPAWTSVPSGYHEGHARMFLGARHDSMHAGESAPFAIVDASDHELLLGSVALMRFDWPHARGEVGYWLTREARGQGHATRAVRLICGWGFDALGLERIELQAATGNAFSQRVAERSGFTREAVLRAYARHKVGTLDMVMFGLLVSD